MAPTTSWGGGLTSNWAKPTSLLLETRGNACFIVPLSEQSSVVDAALQSVCVAENARRRGSPPSAHAARQRTLTLWLRWLLGEFVIPLLRAHFYVTESETHRLEVFYYR